MRRLAAFVFVLGLALTSRARAQETETARAVTLEDARSYARAHRPEVRAALARVEAAKEAASVPRARWLPQFGLSAQVFVATANDTTATNIGSLYLDDPRIGSTRVVNASSATFQPYGTTYAGVGVRQEVFDFGRIAAESAAADALVDVARHSSDEANLDVDYVVEESFYAVLTAKMVLQASQDAYDRTRTHRDLAKAGVLSGLYAPIELTRAEAELARLDIGRVRARGGVTTSQALLAASVGVPDGLLDANGMLPTSSDVPTLANALNLAASRDPRLAAALARARAEEAQTRAIAAEMRPNLWATGSFSGRAGGAPPTTGGDAADVNGWLPSVPNWDVGLVLSWSIYDGTVAARARASRAREAADRADVDAIARVLSGEVRRAYIAVTVSRDVLPSLDVAKTAAIANYDQADARFKAGIGTSVELADAEALRTDAEIKLVLGRFDLARSRAELSRVIAESPR